MEQAQKAKQEVVVFFNEEKVILPKSDWTGTELREFLKVLADNKLFKEEPGKHPDLLVTPETNVSVKNGDKFYDLPPGIKG